MPTKGLGPRDASSFGGVSTGLDRAPRPVAHECRVQTTAHDGALLPGHALTRLATAPGVEAPAREWVAAALLFGLMLAVGVREGGFWSADAFLALLASLICLVVALIANPTNRRDAMVLTSILALAFWWLARAATSDSIAEFLPLGSSIVGFAAAFAAVRPLQSRTREVAGLGVACQSGPRAPRLGSWA